MDINIPLGDEIAMVFFWVGLSGLLDKLINYGVLKQSSIYIYLFLVLAAFYVKL